MFTSDTQCYVNIPLFMHNTLYNIVEIHFFYEAHTVHHHIPFLIYTCTCSEHLLFLKLICN